MLAIILKMVSNPTQYFESYTAFFLSKYTKNHSSVSESIDLCDSLNASYSVAWMFHTLLVVLLFMNFMFLLFSPCCSTSFCIIFSFLFQAYLGFHWDQFVCYRNHPGWTAAEKQVKCFFFFLPAI